MATLSPLEAPGPLWACSSGCGGRLRTRLEGGGQNAEVEEIARVSQPRPAADKGAGQLGAQAGGDCACLCPPGHLLHASAAGWRLWLTASGTMQPCLPTHFLQPSEVLSDPSCTPACGLPRPLRR